ncbi:response regulator [candidate division KSB1 bacterium]
MKSALIIDDDVTSRNVIGAMLKKASFIVQEAEDGWDGVKMLKRDSYDVILLDLKMPGLDGEQVLNIINKLNTDHPTLIVSGFLTKDKVIKLKNSGAKGFLAKPIDESQFYDAVNRLCPFNIPN